MNNNDFLELVSRCIFAIVHTAIMIFILMQALNSEMTFIRNLATTILIAYTLKRGWDAYYS